MKERCVRRLLPFREERDGGLRDVAWKRADTKRGFELPGDDVRGLSYIGRKWFEADLDAGPISFLGTTICELHAIKGINGRQNADATHNDPSEPMRGERLVRVCDTTKAGIDGRRTITNGELGQFPFELIEERPPSLDLLEFLLP